MHLPERIDLVDTFTTETERMALQSMASKVGNGGVIVEIGSLYGGTTAILARSAPYAEVFTIDNFSWTPDGMIKPTAALLRENMQAMGIDNVTVIEGDSRQIGRQWRRPIDLLWIDGGHSFQFVHSDLTRFGKYATIIAAHDYNNPEWPSVKRAIDGYAKRAGFVIAAEVGMLVALERK